MLRWGGEGSFRFFKKRDGTVTRGGGEVKSENHVTDFFNQICVYFRIDHLDYDSIIITIVVTYLVIREFFKLFSKFCKRFPYDFDGLL